jgi:hypothetical protein
MKHAQWRLIEGLSPAAKLAGYRIERRGWFGRWRCVDWWPSLPKATQHFDLLCGKTTVTSRVIAVWPEEGADTAK